MKRLLLALALGLAAPLSAQTRDEQFYYPGSFNWSFLTRYPSAARLFNGFDYGHAVLYQTLVTEPERSVAKLEGREFQFLVGDLLKRPPRFEVAEEAILPDYARLSPRAVQMFHWAHVLHRQVYDVYSDRRLDRTRQRELVERLTDYYLSNGRFAFVDRPKAMELMDGQPYSRVFKAKYPRFNGLIWTYHWLQVGLYESLVDPATPAEADAGIRGSLDHFWAMLDSPPTRMPSVMPMTSAVAPRFSALHPRAAVIFDNLHMLHDIISDILVSDRIPRSEKGSAIERALDEFQNPTTNVIELEHWRMMAEHMGGVERLGGVAGREPKRPPMGGR
jgi:hypothetical protein